MAETQIKIERAYIEQKGLSPWEAVSEEEFIQRTEWAGYGKKGTALQALRDAGQFRTPWAWFRIAKEV